MKISLDSGYPVETTAYVSKDAPLTQLFQLFIASNHSHLNTHDLCCISEDPRISHLRETLL